MATIGTTFDFSYFTRRWNHNDNCKVTLTKKGWYFEYMAIKGDCDEGGKPFVYNNFRQDSVNYPSGVGPALEYLHFNKNELSDEQVQTELNRICDWITATEKATPTDGGLSGLW